MSQQESHIADKFCDDVADSFSGSSAAKRLVLQLGDGVDVVLRGIRGSLGREWIVYGLAPGNKTCGYCVIERTAASPVSHEM